MKELNNSVILVTGGTGSFGKAFIGTLLKEYTPKKVIVFSRDEFKQSEMAKEFSPQDYPIRYFLGDIRDKERLVRAFEGVDYVVHAAALKQVPALEYNPIEAVKTNVDGADNIVNAAIDAGVKKVVSLSTDKASNPSNLYGATKLVAEKIFTAANAYGGNRVLFSTVRYGNVIGSRGSVIPFFQELVEQGKKEIPITDKSMTRFWITLSQAVSLVLFALSESVGGEVFIPKIPSMKIVDVARAICPDCSFTTVGMRPGEKIHETLISEDEARDTYSYKDVFVIVPPFVEDKSRFQKYIESKPYSVETAYRSDSNTEWLDKDGLISRLNEKSCV